MSTENRARLVEDAVQLLETQVATRKGLHGMTLRTGLSMLKSARPDILPRAAQQLLPEFAKALDPLFSEFRASGDAEFGLFLTKHSGRATAALLAVADQRAARASSSIQRTYARMRGLAENEVRRALPGLAELMQRYAR